MAHLHQLPHEQNTDTILTTDGSLELFNAGYLKRSLLVDDGFNIQIDEIRARDIDGLKLYDDGGNGIFIEDGGRVGIGTSIPNAKLNVESPSGGAATIGYGNIASAQYSVAMGWASIASGKSAIAMGRGAQASGMWSVAMGFQTIASANYSTALGINTEASGLYSTAMGMNTEASGQVSLAIGNNTIASGNYSLAIGREIEAGADYVVAIALADMNGLVCSQANSMCIMGGRVGIGTATPNDNLHIFTTDTGNQDMLSLEAAYENVHLGPALKFIRAGSVLARIRGIEEGGWDGGLTFEVFKLNGGSIGRDSATTEAMRIDQDGNVGIGTASPQQLLHLSADNATMNEAIRLQNTGFSVGDEIGIYFRHYTDGRLQAFIKDELTSGWPTKLHFGTAAGVNNAATKMTIDGSGNVGIGTKSPSQKLDIVAGGSGVLISDTGEGRGVAKSLFFGDGGGTWTPIMWGVAGASSDAGLHLLAETKIADDSGTEPLIRLNARQRDSTPITTRPLLAIENDGSQLVTVDKDGNVGIGTINPTQKLDVVGNAKLDGYLGIKDITIQYLNDTLQPVYLGTTGLNDLSSSGVYTGTGTTFYEVKITGIGSPDSFSYREGDTGTFSSPIAITGTAQLIQDGIYVTFEATTGHRMQDVWHIGVGYMLNFDKAVHMEDELFVDGDVTIEGNLKSLSPVKIQDGIILVSRISDTPEFHLFIAGDSTEYTPYLPDAFKYSLVFETLNHNNPSNMHIVFWEKDDNRPSLVLNQGEVGRASVFERSVIIGANKATKTLDTDYTKCNLFSNLVCDTSVTGAELGVEGNVEFLKNLYVTGDIQVNGNVRLNDAKFSINTGILYGGLLSINAGDNTKLDVTAGEAIITDFSDVNAPVINRVSWGAQTIYPNLSGVRSKWIGIRRLGGGSAEFVFDTAFTAEEKRTTAILGRVWGTGTDIITGKGQYSTPSFNLAKTVEDFIDTIGSLNKDGNVFQPNGVNLLLDKTPGHCFRFSAAFAASPPSPNMSTDAEQIGITSYKYHLQESTTTTTESDIEPNYYDVNGVKTAVANNKYTIQRIYFFPVSGTVHITYGQAEYTSLAIASDAIQTEEVVLNTDILSGSVLRAWLIVKQGTTDLSDPTKANIITATNIGSTGGGAAGVTDHTSLSSLEWNIAGHTFNDASQVMDIGSYDFVTSGKVGIGTSSPSSRLTVGSPHATAGANNDLTAVNKIGAYTSGGLGVSIGHVGSERGSIYAYDYGTWTAKNLIINEFGANVGIGNIIPTALLDINSDILRLRTSKTPSSSSDTGNAGDVCWDSNYIYVCIATNTWKRSALSTW